jgi:hypothetical protein
MKNLNSFFFEIALFLFYISNAMFALEATGDDGGVG